MEDVLGVALDDLFDVLLGDLEDGFACFLVADGQEDTFLNDASLRNEIVRS